MAGVEPEMLVAVDGRKRPLKWTKVSLPVRNLHIGHAIFSSNQLGRIGVCVLPRTYQAGFVSYHGHIKRGLSLTVDISSGV